MKKKNKSGLNCLTLNFVTLDTFNFRHSQEVSMFGLGALGKLLVLIGVFIILMGLLLMVGDKIPYLGRLPGDILIKKEKFTFYFPLTTSILISILLTLLFTLLRK